MKINKIDKFNFENKMSRLEMYITKKAIEKYINELTIEDIATGYIYMTGNEMVKILIKWEKEVYEEIQE